MCWIATYDIAEWKDEMPGCRLISVRRRLVQAGAVRLLFIRRSSCTR